MVTESSFNTEKHNNSLHRNKTIIVSSSHSEMYNCFELRNTKYCMIDLKFKKLTSKFRVRLK